MLEEKRYVSIHFCKKERGKCQLSNLTTSQEGITILWVRGARKHLINFESLELCYVDKLLA